MNQKVHQWHGTRRRQWCSKLSRLNFLSELMNKQVVLAGCFLASLFVCGLHELLSQEKSSGVQFAERLSVTVLVVDPDGAPVEGAAVEPTAVISKNDPNASMSWIDDQPNLVKGLVTNQQGEVTLTWPVKLGETFEPAAIFLSIKHPAFVIYSKRHMTNEKRFNAVLQRGFQAAVTAVDAVSGQAIPKHELFASTNSSLPRDWTIKKNGTLVSPVFDEEENSFRLIQIANGQAIRFSDMIHVDLTEQNKFLFRDVKMHASISIRGKLDEKVPRPIKDGWVVAAAVSIREEDRFTYHTAWNWIVYGRIAEDGTFELNGLPPNTQLQMIAKCEGWVNEPLTNGEFKTHFPSQEGNRRYAAPQLVPVGQALTDFEFSMQPTSRCLIKVVDEQDKPIAGATVSAHSNFVFFHGSSATGFHSDGSSVKQMLALRRSPGDIDAQAGESAEKRPTPDKITTDENGLATVANLCGPVAWGHAYHPEYRNETGGFEIRFEVMLKSGQESEATVWLKKLGKTMQVLSADEK